MPLYRTAMRSKKWTLRIIFHYFNTAIINSWSRYKRDTNCSGIHQKNSIDLLDFTFRIVEVLSFSNQSAAPTKSRRLSGNIPAALPPKKKINPSARPTNDVRFDGINHMIIKSSK
ncbi:hypothetical protein AVEN_156093-1 [Araneus ventricosus]|uniref:PiggyBac transposable element-derived protein domain-containing protein n=1 Tax=Araneus ventricosus TaxID=182803 RepID=A0A4Y2K5M7_ARAVE|nr:hypothetical protein AVEN_156093-1 [Araneus ventricosus]